MYGGRSASGQGTAGGNSGSRVVSRARCAGKSSAGTPLVRSTSTPNAGAPLTISGRTAWDATVASRRGQPRARAGPNRASRPRGPVALLEDTRSDCLGGGSPSQRRGVRERAARQACPEATVSTLGQQPTRPRRFAQRVSAALLHHTGSTLTPLIPPARTIRDYGRPRIPTVLSYFNCSTIGRRSSSGIIPNCI